jgi:broad specificity phosphatase PhoE
MQVIDTIFIQPCTNELQAGLEVENQEGRPDMKDDYADINSKTRPVKCSSKDVSRHLDDRGDNCTWNGTLTYWTYPDRWPDRCNDLTPDEFWSNFSDNLHLTFAADADWPGPRVVLLVTHHNRLKKLIAPFRKGSRFNGYANSCIISFSKNQYKVAFTGFPDKVRDGKRKMLGLGGPKGYEYIRSCDSVRDELDADMLMTLDNLFDEPHMQNVIVLVARHGNAQHNKPLQRGQQVGGFVNRPLDSPLTLLGFQTNQAAALAIKDSLPQDAKMYLVASYLNRTQHTAMQITNALTELPPKLKALLTLFDALAISRFRRYLETTWRQDLNEFRDADLETITREYFDATQMKWLETFIANNIEECKNIGGLIGKLEATKIDYDTLYEHIGR